MNRYPVAVVMITRNRKDNVLSTLENLQSLPSRPRIVVVDNGSEDGTAIAVRTAFPAVRVVALGENAGSAGRNIGVREAGTPFVAFADDDSWWDPDAFDRAIAAFEASPRLAVIAGRVLVGPERRLDPTCEEMAASPLPTEADLPGPPVLGFIACGAIVRSGYFLAAGGFHQRYGVGGEEELLALDLAERGLSVAYCTDVVAHHHPATQRDPAGRRRVQARNALWTTWLRRPRPVIAKRTGSFLLRAARDAEIRGALLDAVRGLGWVRRERAPISRPLEERVQLVEAGPFATQNPRADSPQVQAP